MQLKQQFRLLSALVVGASVITVTAAAAPAAPGSESHIVVPLPKPVGLRDAAPLVMNGDTPLGIGTISPDRRSVILKTRAKVGANAALRVVWSGGGVPAPRNAASMSVRQARPGFAPPQPHAQKPLAPGVADPGKPGPLATVRAQYTFGDTALTLPSGAKAEVTGEVTYPTNLSPAQQRPIIVLLHGRHDFCGQRGGKTAYKWPCPAGYRRIPSEQGYRPLADLLASHGNVVVSVAANGINASDDDRPDGGARDRGFLVIHHLNKWRDWVIRDWKGPFGTRFKGTINFTRVGLMGHSRGGEGVVAALAENKRQGSKYGIQAVVPLAPVNFTRQQLKGTPSMTLVPYCDGDVSDLQGVHFFDDATAAGPDRVPHALLGVLGANHNFFNTVWTPGGWEAGTVDDWFETKDQFCGTTSGRLTAKQQVAAGNAYMAAFLRARLQSQAAAYDPLFLGNAATPVSAAPARTVAAWSAPAGRRLLVSNTMSTTTNQLGGAVTTTGFDAALRCGGDTRWALTCLAPRGTGDEPHLGRSWMAPQARGLDQLHLIWSKAGAAWTNTIPAANRDVSGYQHVTVRMTKDAWAFTATPPALGLRITDAAGATKTAPLAGPALNTPVFTGPTGGFGGPVPHALVMAVPVPLSAFSGVDLTNTASVSVVALGGSGDIAVADISFQK